MTYKQLKTLLDELDMGEYHNEEVSLTFLSDTKTKKIVLEGTITGVILEEPFRLIAEETSQNRW